MSQRDPFPMRSDAAKALEASVEGSNSNSASNWSTICTSGNTKNTQSGKVSKEGESAGLMGIGRSSKRTKPGDDIYAIADEEEAAAERKNFHGDDEFLDRPTYESRSRGLRRVYYQAQRAFKLIYKRLYGDKLPPEEMLRTLTLASTLFFMIGGYWLLRSLKDPILTAICGVSVIPKAKMLSVLVVLGVVSIYNYLVSCTICMCSSYALQTRLYLTFYAGTAY